MQPCASNILAVFHRATADQFAAGMRWYPRAADVATRQADGDLRKGAGVIAALSPQKSWGANVKLSARAFETGTPGGTFPIQCRKAAAILAGADPFDVLKGEKERNFARNIIDPSDDQAVTIDRHALEVALGREATDRERSNIGSPGNYRRFAAAYREAAAMVGLLPQQMQAITWLVWSSENHHDMRAFAAKERANAAAFAA